MSGKSSSSQAQTTTTNTNITDKRLAATDSAVIAQDGSTVITTDGGAVQAAQNTAIAAIQATATAQAKAAKAAAAAAKAQAKEANETTRTALDKVGAVTEYGFDQSSAVAADAFGLADDAFDFVAGFASTALERIGAIEESARTGSGEFVKTFTDQLQRAESTENERNFDRIVGVLMAAIVVGGIVYVMRGKR